MGAKWERALFKVCLYGVVAAQAFLVYIAWGEWNVPDWMHFNILGLQFTLPQAAGFCFVGVEAWALVVKDIAESRGHKVKAGWLVALFAFFFALNGVMDWTGWYSVFGGDHSTRSEAVQQWQLDNDEYNDALREAEATIARIVGTEQAPRAQAPRAKAVIDAELAAQDRLDARWREQRIGDLPRRYVDVRARLDAELQERIALDTAREARRTARVNLRALGAEPEGGSPSLGAINGLLKPFGAQIDDQALNAFYSFALMLGMKLCIGVGFWASSFHEAGDKRRRDKRAPSIGKLRDMASRAITDLRRRVQSEPEPDAPALAPPAPVPEQTIEEPPAPADDDKIVAIGARRSGSLSTMRRRFGK